MSAIEQKFIALFSPLPLSLKAKIVALLSQHLASETAAEESLFIEEDVETSRKVRKLISEGKMKLYSEEEFWKNLQSS